MVKDKYCQMASFDIIFEGIAEIKEQAVDCIGYHSKL
jgi:hypothetical protein